MPDTRERTMPPTPEPLRLYVPFHQEDRIAFRRCEAAEAVIRLAQEIGYINGQKGYYGDHCAYKKVISERLANEWNAALSNLQGKG